MLPGTLLFASDDVLDALATGEQPATSHPRQDMVALVKTACVLVHSAVAKAAAGLAERVAQQLPRTTDAVGLVRAFWDQQLDEGSAAGSAWSNLVAAAHGIPGSEDAEGYAHKSEQLCSELAALVCPG